MKLLMISGDRSVAQGKKGAFWYTLEEFSKHWERIDVIVPRSKIQIPDSRLQPFPNVFFHISNTGRFRQSSFILKKGTELINEHHHDVMTTHEFPPFYNGKGARWLHRVTKIPYMTEIHHIVGYPKAVSFSEFIGRITSRIWLPRWGTRDAAKVRTVSDGTTNTLVSWGVPAEKIAMLPSLYLDAAVLAPDSSIEKQYSVVFCGRLVANKGLKPLIKAMQQIPDSTLLVIGDGPEKKSAEALAKSLKMQSRVTFTGWLPESHDVYKAMQTAKMFVMNSTSEGGPRVLFEAMALGLPVISTKVGAAPGFIQEGQNGLFTDGKPADLAAKITHLLADESLRKRMGENAKGILGYADRAKNVKAYADALKAIVPPKSGS
jgi:glycosyltransferase involved in cell wall biosynthesis